MANTGKALGVLMGSIFQNPNQASAMAGVILLPLMMFGGLYAQFNKFPSYIGWMQYISPFKYGFQAAVYNQLNGVVWYTTHFPIVPLEVLGIETPALVSIGILFAIAGGFYVAGFFFLKLFSAKLNA